MQFKCQTSVNVESTKSHNRSLFNRKNTNDINANVKINNNNHML